MNRPPFIVHRSAFIVLFVVVLQVPAETALSFEIEDDRGVDRAGVDMQADRALVPLRKILDAMDRLLLVDRVERTTGNAHLRTQRFHFDTGRTGEAIHPDDLLTLRPVAIEL